MNTLVKKVFVLNLLAATIVSLSAYAFFPTPVASGIAAGMFLMALNLWVLGKVSSTLLQGSAVSTGLSLLALMLKFAGFLGASWLIFRFADVNILAFGGGIAASLFFTSCSAVWAQRQPMKA